MNRDYEPLAASWRAHAERHVRNAQSSNNLRDIVRLIAMASTLEQAARRLSSSTNACENDFEVSDVLKRCADDRIHDQLLRITKIVRKLGGRTDYSEDIEEVAQ